VSGNGYDQRVARLGDAARRKSEAKTAAASRAITRLEAAGSRVNFVAVANTAGVSTDFLYGNSDLRSRIEELRDRDGARPVTPPKERASDASLRVQMGVLKEALAASRLELEQLRRENEVLRGELLSRRGVAFDDRDDRV
jgi:hypothetical protein